MEQITPDVPIRKMVVEENIRDYCGDGSSGCWIPIKNGFIAVSPLRNTIYRMLQPGVIERITTDITGLHFDCLFETEDQYKILLREKDELSGFVLNLTKEPFEYVWNYYSDNIYDEASALTDFKEDQGEIPPDARIIEPTDPAPLPKSVKSFPNMDKALENPENMEWAEASLL